MRAIDITANGWERRPIKRKAHLFSLLAVLAIIASGVYRLVSDAPLEFWFWFLAVGAGNMVGLPVVFWVFERPQQTLLVGHRSRRRPHDLE